MRMVTLSTLAVQISISHVHYHSRKSAKRRLRYRVDLKEVDMQQKSSEGRFRLRRHCTKSDGPVIKPRQTLPRFSRSMIALVAHFLPWNFVKFTEYIAMAEYIEVSNAHRRASILQTFSKTLFRTRSKVQPIVNDMPEAVSD